MALWKFILNPDSDAIEIEEPSGFAELELSITRDENLHGIQFEASTNAITFFGRTAFDYLQNQKNTNGLKSVVIFQALSRCDEDSDFDEVMRGKLNFGQYEENCGDVCTIQMPVESDACDVQLKSQYDQKVDLDNSIAFDKITGLPGYPDLAFDTVLNARELDYKSEGYVADGGDIEPTSLGDGVGGFIIRPQYENKVAENIQDTQLDNSVNLAYYGVGGGGGIISPVVLFDENPKFFPSGFNITGRVKGRIGSTYTGVSNVHIHLWVWRGELDSSNFDLTTYGEIIATIDPVYNGPFPFEQEFDLPFTYHWIPNTSGTDGIYVVLNPVGDLGPIIDYTVVFDKETFFKAESTKVVPPSKANAYMVHETLSRVTEAITNQCIRVKSSYYGRTDSAPFDFDTDGCGGLRFFTSGLKLRNAPNAKFFASLKDLIEGLQCIDNIGMGLEVDETSPRYFVLRVEALEYFYTEAQIIECAAISKAVKKVEENRCYSKINIGYKKWETQANFGLDEFNSNREYRTSIISISNTLDKTSALVAGEYAIELTREQSFVDTSGADTTYDNEIFIICMKRNGIYGYAYGGLVPEQGNVTTPENIFSPDTIYNYGITPVRNLMRWFRSLMPSYANIDRLIFNAGTGNFIAKGIMTDAFCRLEANVISENQDLAVTNFADQKQAQPLWRNEVITFDYPMSIGDYKKIKANPYGYISYQCGDGDFEKGYIKEIKFKIAKGVATYSLRKKWE